MRFDNPIYDHGFTFPDIAQFPDVIKEKRYISEGEDKNIPLMYEAIKKSDIKNFIKAYKDYMTITDQKLFDKLNTMFQFYSNFENTRIESKLPANKIYEDLFENGISYLNYDIRNLKQILKPEIESLLKIPDWKPPPGHFDRSKQLDENIVKIINNIFEEIGILQAASKYNKAHELKVKNVLLHIAKPTDHNWQQFLYDCKTITKTINLHIDPKENVIKSMLYLNEVTPDNGPFSYVEKSNRWIYDDLQNIFGRAISTGSYCYSPESRAIVFQLPKQLRVSYNFGRVLLDNTYEQETILKREKLFTSDKGNLCVFDPAGMHRGGICKKGIRVALQILMK